MGEGYKPELVTVTPFTRGTGNHAGPTVSNGGRFGGGQPIVIENIITLDGQVIDRRIRKVALGRFWITGLIFKVRRISKRNHNNNILFIIDLFKKKYKS